MADPTLKINGVSKIFSRVDSDSVTHGVTDVNLEMDRGEFVSIVGTSGSGKSTILRMVAGLIPPTTGEILVDGEKLVGPGPKIGMVFQKATLFPWLTVEGNISYSLRMQHKYKENKDEVDRLIKVIGLEDFRKDYPGQLSGGMAQRVALARAIINKPEILLMDEPLGALDAFTRMNMQKEILDMWEMSQQLVIMVTHDIDEAVFMSSRIIIMDKSNNSVAEDLSIDIPHPRSRSSAQFIEYRNHILEKLVLDKNAE